MPNFNGPKQKIYIPTYISSVNYAPARVLPRLLFYNGELNTDPYYIQNASGSAIQQVTFPYFDNYQGSLPNTGSLSLLFFNEPSVYGTAPTASLYSEYWSTYVNLLYNPRTRVINCKGIIPLADYYQIELNDIVEWRGNYYHLRAINDYNLSNGECNIQLLGPTIGNVIANVLPGAGCDFDFSVEDYVAPPTGSVPVSWSFNISNTTGNFYVYNEGNTLAFLNANGSGSTSVTASSYVTASITPVDYPSSGSVTMSLYVNGVLQTTSNYNQTISASFSAVTGSVYSITGSMTWNSGSTPPPPPDPNYNYYLVDRYTCASNNCTFAEADLVARTTSSLSLVMGYYYTEFDGNNYLVTGEIASQSADVDFISPYTYGTNCNILCII